MATLDVVMPTLHPDQREVKDDESRFKVLACGRRWGKSRLACVIAIAVALRGGRVWWIGPSYPMASIGWRLLKRLTIPLKPKKSETERRLEFAGGGEIWVKSADNPDSLRGEGLDLAIFDECAFMREAAWIDSIRPALTDREGSAIFISTPKGRNWFWRLWSRADSEEGWSRWQYPSANNPYLSEAEIENARNTLPENTYRQEYLAEFLENQGVVFRNIGACSTLVSSSPSEHKGHRIVIGNDWGKQNDFTTVSVFCADCNQEVQFDRFNQIDFTVQRGRLKALADRWKASCLSESNSIGVPIIEQLQREGLDISGFETTGKSKPPLIESLVLAFEREEAHWIDDRLWSGELEAYERKVNPMGHPSYSAPEGMHDDTVIARALAWKAAQMGEAEFRWA